MAFCLIYILIFQDIHTEYQNTLGSIKIGLIAMIPNRALALVVGGTMGFAHIPLDIMTVTIMPTLLGLAVDDTIHWF
ncbi:MAG: hypothetical protein CSA26_00105 [Desulfobacterales bacterium]|nr:MAG: hypothetical protein CSA26_00105 [Desulfobacterales bacterium]